ncbi:recombinase RecT [Gemmatimonas sp. UBA7669]|uniref:recombinase RecT n=1 Tax=Gemmatimonas sp. UBA7669 TaxID=1946568 RepID=UPI0025B8D86F|nr:recombinase RecT [Gemmatimonas sp. UBA7669]
MTAPQTEEPPVTGPVHEGDPAPQEQTTESVEETNDRRILQIMQVVGGDKSRAEKVMRLAAGAVKKVPALGKCKATSLWLAVLDVAGLNLPFGGRGAYLVPYKGEVQVIIAPHGLIELAYRHPLVKSVQARVVRDGEPFDIQFAPDPTILHKPLIGGKAGDKIGAYMIVELTTGGRVVEWMTKAEVEEVRAVSKSFAEGKGPWIDWEDEMWRKSALKRGMKYVPQSEELMRALDLDDEESDLAIKAAPAPMQLTAGRGGVDALSEQLAKRRQQAAAAVA